MSPSAKADRLKARLHRPAAIDPDALAAPTVPASVPAPAQEPAAEVVPASVPEEPVDVAPDPTPEPAPVTTPAPTRPSPRRATRRPGAPAKRGPVLNALEDPGITPGKKDYRSFYVDDAPFARYRAAIYWASRNPDVADEVAENMSADIEDHMLAVAADLEKRLNGGEPFRMPPDTNRRGRKSSKSGQ